VSDRRKAANGAGSVFLRKDGRWCGALYVTEADGRRVRRRVYGKSRKEVETKLVELRSAAETGAAITPAHLTVEAFLHEWLDQIVAQRVRPNTLAAYAMYTDRYLVPDLGKRRLGRLTAREVRLYLDTLRRRGVGVRSIRYVHATLRAALEDAMREELLEKNVAKLVRPPSTVKTERHPLTVDEVRSFLRSTRDNRLHALFVVLAVLGVFSGGQPAARCSELGVSPCS
jgi:integrase